MPGMSGGGSVKAGKEVAAGLREAKLRASIVSMLVPECVF